MKVSTTKVAGEFRRFISSSKVVPMYRSKDSLNDSVNKLVKDPVYKYGSKRKSFIKCLIHKHDKYGFQ